MLILISKEIKYFFLTPVGYFVLGTFWTFNTLLFISIDNDLNLFQSKFIDFNEFFTLMPLMLIFLVPTIVMRTFSEEIQLGTIDIIVSKPISNLTIIWSKFFGCLFILIICILPTFFYIIYAYQFSILEDDNDFQLIIGSYFGLLALGSNFTGISLPISIIFKNQINVLITSTFLCFCQYYLLTQLSDLSNSDFLYNLILNSGSQEHYLNFVNGVISTNDIGYFFGSNILFMGITLYFFNKSRYN
tara:strand:+ start:4914 stop:5648 length:735 start_codon:yes stop_codon:yes gene_type:complete